MPKRLTPEMIELVAERFRALAEPARLHIMQALRSGEKTVGDLVEVTGLGTANVSKHLQHPARVRIRDTAEGRAVRVLRPRR